MKLLFLFLLISIPAFGGYLDSDGPTYTRYIAPVFSKHCSRCHNSESPLPDFGTYRTAYEYRYKIQEKVNSREMPHSGNFKNFEKERELINLWVNSGAKK